MRPEDYDIELAEYRRQYLIDRRVMLEQRVEEIKFEESSIDSQLTQIDNYINDLSNLKENRTTNYE